MRGGGRSSDFLPVFALPVLGAVCCLGLPLLLAALGSGAALWLLGVGAPLALAATVIRVALAALRRRRLGSRTVLVERARQPEPKS